MADIATITQRAGFTAQALATMGVDPTWDAKLTAYLRAEALEFADDNFGAFSAACEKQAREEMRMKYIYGENVQTNPRAVKGAEEMRDEYQVAEDRWYKEFTKPHWAATRELIKTPAPTLAAALYKVSVAYAEDGGNDSEIADLCMELVQADFARLAGEV